MPPPLVLFALLLPASLAAQLPLTPPGSPTTVAAPETVDILRARLLHQPLYLRSAAAGEHLSFAPDGSLTPAAPPTSFTLSGVEIDSVDRKSDHLVLKGKRVGLTFPDNHLKRNILRTPIVLDIAAPADGQYIRLTITPEGHLDNMVLVNAAGLGLDEEAINAVRQYVFAPASRNGIPIACQVNININFRAY